MTELIEVVSINNRLEKSLSFVYTYDLSVQYPYPNALILFVNLTYTMDKI